MNRKRVLLIGSLLLLAGWLFYWLEHRLPFDSNAVDRIEIVYGAGQRVTVTDPHTLQHVFRLLRYSTPFGIHCGDLECRQLRFFSGDQELQSVWLGDYNEWGYDGKVKGFSNSLDELLGSLYSDATDSFAGSKAGDEREVGGVKLCWCPDGKFVMGSPASEPERRPGEDQVEVTLTKGFWMGKYEVTQRQWKRVVGDFPGKLSAGEGDDFPVYAVNFAEAQEFCTKLTEQARASGDLPGGWWFRLPTEAQWEYACRAGTTTATSFGDKLSSKQANFQGKPYNGAEAGPSLQRAAPVGSYPANPWGLHDMHGNVFEWCRDWHHAKLPGGVDPDLSSAKTSALVNRTGNVSRVRRGGCWADEGWPCRSAFRLRFEPERRSDHIGFRVAVVRP